MLFSNKIVILKHPEESSVGLLCELYLLKQIKYVRTYMNQTFVLDLLKSGNVVGGTLKVNSDAVFLFLSGLVLRQMNSYRVFSDDIHF